MSEQKDIDDVDEQILKSPKSSGEELFVSAYDTQPTENQAKDEGTQTEKSEDYTQHAISIIRNCKQAAMEFENSSSYSKATDNAKNLLTKVKSLFSESRLEALFGFLANYILQKVVNGWKSNNQISPAYRVPELLAEIFTEIFCSADKFVTDAEDRKELCKHFITFIQELNDLSSKFFEKSRVIEWRNRDDGYPKLILGTFEFSDTEHFELYQVNMSQSQLTHATTSNRLVEMLNLSDRKASFLKDMVIFIESKYELRQLKEHHDICSPNLVYFRVDIPEESLNKLEKKGCSWAVSYFKENRYGSTVITFPFQSNLDSNYNFFKLGTKKYNYEYSQIMSASNKSHPRKNELIAINENNLAFKSVEEIDNISEYVWDVKFSRYEGFWTHPEIAVVGGLDLNLLQNECKISFVDHKCVYECNDCLLYFKRSIKATKMVVGVGSTPLSVDVSSLFNYSKDKCSASFALRKFAFSIPPNERQILFEIKQVFEDNDFKNIQKVWDEECKDFYFRDWDICKIEEKLAKLVKPLR